MPRSALALLVALCAGCLPYSVGQTAGTLPAGENAVATTIQFVPVFEPREEGEPPTEDGLYGSAVPQFDGVVRFGLDERTEATARLVGGVGASVAVKRLLSGDETGPATAVLGGVGVLNGGQHAHGELTFIVSGAERNPLVPYAGVRAFQTVPIGRGAVSDAPTIGGFVGLRLGSLDFGASPEIGVFYDPPALGLRESSVVVVPSLTFHGREILRYLY